MKLTRFWSARTAQKEWPRPEVRRWIILQQNNNPSTDYYVRPYLERDGVQVQYRDIERDAPRIQDLESGTGVVIVRYLNAAWAKALRAHRARLSEVVYFMDDDLLQPERWVGLPRAYIKKLNAYCRPYLADIRQLASSYWVSTATLQNRYRQLGDVQVVAPQPMAADWQRPRPATGRTGPVWLFYHGTAAHHTEIEWLRPVIAQVLQRCERVHFEIMGNHDVNQRYRDLPRTRILHPMSWGNYQSHCRAFDADIGLAPLLPSPFNAGRSHTKAYDIARCGAVGVYSAGGPYDAVISHAENGLLLSNDPQLWADTLCRLAQDATERDRLRLAAAAVLRRSE